jgi:hypothetical protein
MPRPPSACLMAQQCKACALHMRPSLNSPAMAEMIAQCGNHSKHLLDPLHIHKVQTHKRLPQELVQGTAYLQVQAVNETLHTAQCTPNRCKSVATTDRYLLQNSTLRAHGQTRLCYPKSFIRMETLLLASSEPHYVGWLAMERLMTTSASSMARYVSRAKFGGRSCSRLSESGASQYSGSPSCAAVSFQSLTFLKTCNRLLHLFSALGGGDTNRSDHKTYPRVTPQLGLSVVVLPGVKGLGLRVTWQSGTDSHTPLFPQSTRTPIFRIIKQGLPTPA